MRQAATEPYRLYVLSRRDLRSPEGTRVSSVLAQPKRLCLLMYLALARQPVSRSTLTALFWPETDEVRARNNLNQALHYLRRSMSKGIVESIDGDQLLWVPPERLWCDARELLHGASLNGELAGTSHRELLEGWNAEDSQPLQEWLDAVRREVRDRAAEVEDEAGEPHAPAPEPDAVNEGRRATGPTAVAVAVMLVIVWVVSGMPLPGPAPGDPVLTPGTAPVTIVFPTPVFSPAEDTPSVLAGTIRHQILARLSQMPGIVVDEALQTATAWDRRQLEAIDDPAGRRLLLEVITIVSHDRLSTSVALVGGGQSLANTVDLPFSTRPELLLDLPERIAATVAGLVSDGLVGSPPGAPARAGSTEERR